MHTDITPVDTFRRAFHTDRLAVIKAHGPETFDQAQVLYQASSGERSVVIRDAYHALPGGAGAAAFLQGLTEGWWARRQTFEGQAEPGEALAPVAGLYARYLPEVGFDYSVEFGPEGPTKAWRMDGRGKVTPLALPTDEGMFRDQTGTFFDPRAGWRWLVGEFRRTGRVAVAEIQGGYQIGVRQGVPDDPNPADREDEQLAEVFSRWDPHDYDTLEFLNGMLAEDLPLPGERFDEWLGEAAAAAGAGELDLFVLAESSEFLACVEDVAKERGIAVEWIDPDEEVRLAFHAGPLRLEREFSFPYLQTLHTGRSFVAGALAYFGPALDALDEARALLDTAKGALAGHAVDVVDGTVMRVRDGAGREVRRFDLLALAGRQPFHGEQGKAEFLKLIGWDAGEGRFLGDGTRDLRTCPVTGAPARVGKVIRPARLLGMDPRTLVGMPVGDHVVYYTLDSATHSTPITPGPERDLQAAEAAWRAALPDTPFTVTAARAVDEAWIIAGFDAGSMVLAPGRVKAVLEALDQPTEGHRYGMAPHPDVLVVAHAPLAGGALDRVRQAALELQRAHFPGRSYGMAVARELDLDTEPAQGLVTLAD
ncbi:MAG: hypothetical protein KC613_08420 [Myxococcales bacterium]|nr:hypothetical protein [Myxococcales bacterium]